MGERTARHGTAVRTGAMLAVDQLLNAPLCIVGFFYAFRRPNCFPCAAFVSYNCSLCQLRLAAFVSYSCSLCQLWLQPLSAKVAASGTHGCMLGHLWLQRFQLRLHAWSPTVAAFPITVAGCRRCSAARSRSLVGPACGTRPTLRSAPASLLTNYISTTATNIEVRSCLTTY